MSTFSRYKPSFGRKVRETKNRSGNSLGVSATKRSSSRTRPPFYPMQHETKSSQNVSSSKTPAMVLKNGGINAAAGEIKDLLDELVPYRQTQINTLDPKVADVFNRIVNYVNLLFNTPHYTEFNSWVEERYLSMQQNNVIPGTVGAYLIGCNISTSFSDSAPGCAVACASARPLPKTHPKFHHCENTVILGKFNGHNYRFTLLMQASDQTNHENAYLYITSTDQSYPGFSKEEKTDLKSIGIKKIKLFGTYPDGKTYVELTNNLVPLEKLKSRNSHPAGGHDNGGSVSDSNDHQNQAHKNEPPTSGANSAWIILIIIIVLVIVFLIWYWSSRNRQNNQYQNMNYYQNMGVAGPGSESLPLY